MKLKRLFLSVLLILALCAALYSCKKEDKPAETSGTASVATTAAVTESETTRKPLTDDTGEYKGDDMFNSDTSEMEISFGEVGISDSISNNY